MTDRLTLHDRLLQIVPHVYFQPPSNVRMNYPCIVYNKSTNQKTFANNQIYTRRQEYTITAMDRDPDSLMGEQLEDTFDYCYITNRFTMDGLHQTTLNLYY